MDVTEKNISSLKIQTDRSSNKYLSFYLEGQRYGLNILNVREIISFQIVTRIPKTENYVRGVINLRGQVITVVDLRLKFGLAAAEVDRDSCVVVVEHEGIDKPIGLLVDGVSEVIDIADSDIDKSSESDLALDGEYIHGIGKHDDGIMILLSVNSITNN